MRTVQDAAMPKGSAWNPVIGGDNDNLLEGMAENQQSVEDSLDQLQWVRNPQKTSLLSDLEKEYGTYNGSSLTEQQRRDKLDSAKNARQGDGTDVFMQARLRAAGFDVYVHRNNPAVDPSTFISNNFQMYAGGQFAYAGHQAAFAGQIGGEYVVNGDMFSQSPDYIGADNQYMFAGHGKARAGYYESVTNSPIVYLDPPSGYYSLVFFVGGLATRDVNGFITNIDYADVPFERVTELKELIVKYKPMFSWCGLLINEI